MSTEPGNPNCTAGDNGKPCAACASDWSKVGPIPTERCLPEPSVTAPRVVDEANRQFCSCNHCFVVKREQRNKEEKAVHAIADALSDLYGFIEDGSLVRCTARDDEPAFAIRSMKLVLALKRADEVLRLVGRIP